LKRFLTLKSTPRDGENGSDFRSKSGVVRDPESPDRISPLCDGGDGLHFNAHGYEQIADTIDLTHIKGNDCKAY